MGGENASHVSLIRRSVSEIVLLQILSPLVREFRFPPVSTGIDLTRQKRSNLCITENDLCLSKDHSTIKVKVETDTCEDAFFGGVIGNIRHPCPSRPHPPLTRSPFSYKEKALGRSAWGRCLPISGLSPWQQPPTIRKENAADEDE